MIDGVSFQATDVVQSGRAKLCADHAHLLGSFLDAGLPQEQRAMERRLGNGDRFIGGAIVDAKIAVEAATATIHRRMREAGHDPGSAIAIDAILWWHQANVADFVPQSGVGEGLDGVEHLPVLGAGNAFEQVNLGIAGEYDPVDGSVDPAGGQAIDVDHQPPRWVSRKSLTIARSTTCPASRRSSGALPLNSGLSLGDASHRSACVGSGSRICRDL